MTIMFMYAMVQQYSGTCLKRPPLGPKLVASDRWSYYAGTHVVSTEKGSLILGPQEVATIGRWLPYAGSH